MHRHSRTAYAALAFLVAGSCIGLAPAADKPPAGKDSFARTGENLIKGLKETPGCLGVESGQMASGKLVIFAFFENKKAAMKWYFSPTHRQVMELLSTGYEGKHAPMKGVPDGVPVMAVASLTISDKPVSEKSKLPVSQIAVELYTPLTAGLNIGGGFAPDAFRALVPKPSAKPEARK